MRALATDLKPERERRRLSATSKACNLPLSGVQSQKSRRYSMVDRLRSLTQMDAHPHVHASVHAHCAPRFSLPVEVPCIYCSVIELWSTFSVLLSLYTRSSYDRNIYLWQIEQVLKGQSLEEQSQVWLICQHSSEWLVLTDTSKHL